MSEFKRETAYVVLKIKDLRRYCSAFNINAVERVRQVTEEGRAADGRPPLETVVVERDWPEFDSVWKSIEARMTTPNTDVSGGFKVASEEDQSDLRAVRDELARVRGLCERAIARARVFDDGSDGADAESAQSVVAILSEALTPRAGSNT